MIHLKNLFSKARLLLVLSFGICTGTLALTPAGTQIINRAEISYQVTGAESLKSFNSNPTIVVVGSLYAFSVENTHTLTVPAGVVAQFPHQINNNGNVVDAYSFSYPGHDAERFAEPIVYFDRNGNGRVDPGEPEIDVVNNVIPEQSVDVVVTVRLSPDLLGGKQYPFTVVVESENSENKHQLDNAIKVGVPGHLELAITTFPECSAPVELTDVLTHTVEINKTGAGGVPTTDYLIDGELMSGAIVEIAVSEQTAFYKFQETNSPVTGINVVKLEGAAANEWIRAGTGADNNQVVSAGFFFQPSELTFNEPASFVVLQSIRNVSFTDNSILTKAFYDVDSDATEDYISSSSCNSFLATGAAIDGEILFLEPAPGLRLSGSTPEFNRDGDFVTSPSYELKRSESDRYETVRDGVYLQLNLDGLNSRSIKTDSVGNRYVVVELTSEITGDLVTVILLETARMGEFRSIAPIALSTTDRSNGGTCPTLSDAVPVTPLFDKPQAGCLLQSADNDRLLGRFGDVDTGYALAGVVSVGRQSTVFDVLSGSPVKGVGVQFRRVDTDEIGLHPLTNVPFEYITSVEGKFNLPRFREDVDYYLVVTPPVGYQFPSVVPPFRLTNYNVHGFSYGREGYQDSVSNEGVQNRLSAGVFAGSVLNLEESIDIPLDRGGTGRQLAIDKVANSSVVEIGQSLFYSVTVKNLSAENLTDVAVTDTLPFGFRYVDGTTLRAGVASNDPLPAGNGDLVFPVGSLAAGEAVIISYAVRATAAAMDSSGINTAVASGLTASRQLSESMPAKAKVTLQRSGVFSHKAALFGKIYVDQNCDGIQNNKEWPIGGVRLYLHDGTYVISDADGQYSLYGLEPGQYVLKVDTYTMPEGLQLKLLSTDQAADASSRFVDLSEGDYHRTDFATACPQQDQDRIFAELKQRNLSIDGSWHLAHAERLNGLDNRYRADPRSQVSAADGDLSNGVIDGPKDFDVGAVMPSVDQLSSDETEKASALEARQLMPDAKEIVSNITTAQAKEGTWLWPLDDVSVNGRFMAVVRSGIDPKLFVNGVAVPSTQIGERIVNRREKAQVVAWYGVELDSGENTVEVRGKDSFGNDRVLAKGIFKRPSSGTQITLSTDAPSVPADGGRTTLPVTVKILDANGYPALGVYYVTLESSEGSWVEPDIQDGEPGRQVRIENGERTLHYRPSGQTGDVQVRVSTGEFSGEISIRQVAEKRPLVVSGFISADAYLTNDSLGDFAPSVDLGEFESSRFESRAAVFIKGTVKEDYNLTFSYDSAKSREQQLLRDIDPALNYPIHGDASIRGFEAQSRSKLYVRLERDDDSVMYGDFLTDPSADRYDLARISRALTGFNAVVNDEKNSIRIFAAREENTNVSEEIPGNGSALLYRVRRYPLVPNSETVELITRSRENPGLILDTVRLNRLGDYTIDDELGYLTFPATIPTLDQNQNPVFIRVTYDVDSGGENHTVSGVRYDRKVNDQLSIGASATYDGHEVDGKRLVGVHGQLKLGSKTRLNVSVASSESERLGSGNAHSISVEQRWSSIKGAKTVFTHASADAEFANPGAAVAAGRSETSVQHSQQLKGSAKLMLEANDTRSKVNDNNRRTLSALVETYYNEWQVRAGVRQIAQQSGPENNDLVTSILGLRRKFSFMGKSSQANLEYEQDLGLLSRRRVALGFKTKLHEKVSGYANYELSNSLLGVAGIGGDLASESLTLGVESGILPSTKLYSEYRMRGAFESRDYESASGVRGDYEIKKGLRVSPHFEFIKRLGVVQGDSISASVGITDTRNPNSRRLLRLETRRANDSKHFGLRASMTSRVNNDWTAILTDNFSRQENNNSPAVQRHTFVSALARRPKYDNKHHMLFMYRLKQERGVTEGVDRTAHILSTHQNYQLSDQKTLSGRFGFKRDTSWFANSEVSDFATLADARINYDFNRRVGLDARLGFLSTDGLSEMRYSMGVGMNYTVNRRLRIGASYNIAGFREEDLDESKYNARGLRFGLQYKLDEEQFEWLK